MRNSWNKINTVISATLIGMALAAQAAPEFSKSVSREDTVFIRSDKAWEDSEPNIIHFAGHFELKASDWYLTADQATLYGRLDEPDTVILTGSPARFELRPQAGDQQLPMTGTAQHIEYLRDLNIIRLTGGAELARDENVMHSEEIEYEVDTDRFHASGGEGVYFRATPEN